jgi:two-component system sensor histidine kinase QseC
MTSLRARLILALSLSLLVALGAGGAVLYGLVRRGLQDEVDARLDASLLPALESIAETAAGRPDDEEAGSFAPDFERRLESEFADARSGTCFAAFGADGAVIAKSPALGEASLAPPEDFTDESVHYDLVLPDGEPGRALAVHAAGHTVVVASNAASMRRRLATLRTLLLAVGAATWLSAVVVGRFALARGLAPFSRFVAKVERVDADGAGERFDAASLPAELAPIAGKLEQLLARTRAALARERRFNAAVAHELRTPVAELRAVVDVALAGERDAASLELALQDVDGATRHLDALVRALLSLRKGAVVAKDANGETAAPIRLREQFELAVKRATAARAAPPIDATFALDDAVTSAGDASRLRAILDNLLANAAEYAPAATRVTVDAAVEGARFHLRVRNRSPAGLASADVERFFEPFWSKAPHGGATPHAGLGLFVARAFAESSGWRLEARLVGEGGDDVEFELSGPCAVATSSPSRA